MSDRAAGGSDWRERRPAAEGRGTGAGGGDWRDRRPSPTDRGSGSGGDRRDGRPTGDRARSGATRGPAGGRGHPPRTPAGRSSERTPPLPSGPEIPDWVDTRELDPAIRAALRSLETRNAQRVAEHLVAAGTLVDEDPVEALAHARAARDRAARVAAVREAVGVAAYHAGDYAEAARELRAYRRMSGDDGYRAVLADCERALGRPDVALRLVREALGDEAAAEEATELRLVEAGARADLGELPAALLVLEESLGGRPRPEDLDPTDENVMRLATAYADLLAAAGHPDSERWQSAVAASQPEEDDVAFGEEDLPVADAVRGAADEVTDEVVAEDGARGPRSDVPRLDLEDDLLDLPGASAADIEAEVAELLGESDEEIGDQVGDEGTLGEDGPDGGTAPEPRDEATEG